MKILLVNLPVHISTVMPYSIVNMHAVLSSELDEKIKSLDLNAIYHYTEFSEYYIRLEKREEYFSLLNEFVKESRINYPLISKAVLNNKIPKGYNKIVKRILNEKPDVVALSIVYNSQIFFAKLIIEELIKNKIKVIIGGPGDYSIIKNKAIVLNDYNSLIDYLNKLGARPNKNKCVLDYSVLDKKYYFTPDLVYTLRTATSCPYKLCTFCTHHANKKYNMIDLNFIKETIVKNNIKKICFIDDCITVSRLDKLADMLIPLKLKWWAQLRPTKEIIKLLPKLKKSGLSSVCWGVESGNQRILDLIKKGTNVNEISNVLKESYKNGIINQVYIMFGFPTETREEFYDTIKFLEKNKDYIDLVSPSVFGLQKGSEVFEKPSKFGIKNIKLSKRTFLSDKISYEVNKGISSNEIIKLKKKNQAKIEAINKMPKVINSCKEQVLNL